jgi:hypothetical protein
LSITFTVFEYPSSFHSAIEPPNGQLHLCFYIVFVSQTSFIMGGFARFSKAPAAETLDPSAAAAVGASADAAATSASSSTTAATTATKRRVTFGTDTKQAAASPPPPPPVDDPFGFSSLPDDSGYDNLDVGGEDMFGGMFNGGDDDGMEDDNNNSNNNDMMMTTNDEVCAN